MKKVIIVAFIASSICGYSQKELFGKWNVSCPIEFIDQLSSKHCTLCNVVQIDKSTISVQDIELTIDKDEIVLNVNGKKTNVKYSWHSDIHTIEFTYKDQIYKFKTLYNCGDNRYILKDADGLLITLDKKG